MRTEGYAASGETIAIMGVWVVNSIGRAADFTKGAPVGKPLVGRRLFAGTPLEPEVPNGDNPRDWAISRQPGSPESPQRPYAAHPNVESRVKRWSRPQASVEVAGESRCGIVNPSDLGSSPRRPIEKRARRRPGSGRQAAVGVRWCLAERFADSTASSSPGKQAS